MNKGISPAARCRVSEVEYRGWRAIELSNGVCKAVAVPDVGGRIMSFCLGPYEYLWVNPHLMGKLFSAEENMGDGSLAAWKNYGGSKTWPAPQGWDTDDQWHGPPDPVLDSGRYRVERAEVTSQVAVVRMVSPPDPRTGVQITREVTLHAGAGHATLHLEMRNVSDREREWSIWDVVQMDATRRDAAGEATYNDAAWVYVPLNPASQFTNGYRVMFGAGDNPEWQPNLLPGLLGAQYQFRVGKIGVDSPAGWLAFVNQDVDFAFCQRFTYFEDEIYPDGGTTVACWTTGQGEIVGGYDWSAERLYHVEAEVVGPLRRLAPGATQHFDIEWNVARCRGPVVNVTEGGCCHERLHVSSCNAALRLSGSFGVFASGVVELVWLDSERNELVVERLGFVDPLRIFDLDVVRTAPEQACLAMLRVHGQDGIVRQLDEAELG